MAEEIKAGVPLDESAPELMLVLSCKNSLNDLPMNRERKPLQINTGISGAPPEVEGRCPSAPDSVDEPPFERAETARCYPTGPVHVP